MPRITEAEFRSAILPFTLQEEGGLSTDKNDPGNWTGGKVGKGTLRGTKYGIAASAHPTLDIAHLTLDQACDIYWADYCVGPGFDALTLPLLQVVFDAGVNCGPTRARAWLALASNKAAVEDQIKAFSAANLAYHRTLATWSRYGKGWSVRIAACQQRALTLIAAAPVAIASPAKAPDAATPRSAPKAATQPKASLFTQFVRTLADGLFSPLPHGVHA